MDIRIKASIQASSKASFDKLWIKYSQYADGTDFVDTWESGYDYIGFAVAYLEPTEKEAYNWCKFSETVDTEMSGTSENAVQNKVIKEYVDTLTENKVINGMNSSDVNIDVHQDSKVIIGADGGTSIKIDKSISGNNAIVFKTLKDKNIFIEAGTGAGGDTASINLFPRSKKILVNNSRILNVAQPIDDTDAAPKKYVDDKFVGNVWIMNESGGDSAQVDLIDAGVNASEIITVNTTRIVKTHSEINNNFENNIYLHEKGKITFNTQYSDSGTVANMPIRLCGVNTPVDNTDATNKQYVDSKIKQYLLTLEASNWSNNEMTVTVIGVTSINNVIINPNPSSQEAYTSAGILSVAQSTDSLTFTCENTPSVDINVNILILG